MVIILREACGIEHSEVGILGLIGSGFSDIIKAGPEELTCGKVHIPVIADTVLDTFRTPARDAVSERRTLLVFVGEFNNREREMIDSPALYET